VVEVIEVFTEESMKDIFYILELTKGIPQDENYHPEGDVFTHSLQTYYHAIRESDDTDLILAALLHDVGKALGLEGHDHEGGNMIKDYVSAKTRWLVEQHMRVWTLLKGEMKRPGKVKALSLSPWFTELVLLARWDKMARNPRKKTTYNKARIVDQLNRRGINRFDWKTKGYKFTIEDGYLSKIERTGNAWQT
jgi:predicted HD phosphohydrolase